MIDYYSNSILNLEFSVLPKWLSFYVAEKQNYVETFCNSDNYGIIYYTRGILCLPTIDTTVT